MTVTINGNGTVDGLSNLTSGDLTVDTNTLYVDSTNNNVGIGTSSPTQALTVNGRLAFSNLFSASNIDGIFLQSGIGTTVNTVTGNNIAFNSGTTERMRIDSNGNVGIGTSSPARRLDVVGGAGNGVPAAIFRPDNAAGINVVIQRDSGGSGTAAIGTSTNHNFSFLSNNTERARIDASGNFLINTTSIGSNTGKIYVNGGISGVSLVGRQGVSGTSNGSNFNFWWTGAATQLWVDFTNLGNIQISSDYRIKKNIETQTQPAIDRLLQLRPVNYEFADYGTLFKADGVQREGFIAHELAEVIPSAVEGKKDEENQIQSLKLDALCSVMVKAIQEQQDIIKGLETRIQALEGN